MLASYFQHICINHFFPLIQSSIEHFILKFILHNYYCAAKKHDPTAIVNYNTHIPQLRP